MVTGTVKWFDPEKGYGFIAGAEGTKDVFVHVTETQGGDLNEGDLVEYSIGVGPKGDKAEQVRVTQRNPNPPSRRPRATNGFRPRSDVTGRASHDPQRERPSYGW